MLRRMKLYSYFRSSAAFRVRIALGLKGLPFDYAAIHLAQGEQLRPSYRATNPEGLVPALEADDALLTQSLAIMEYLDETSPQSPLLPTDAVARAKVRALALSIACDVHPLNNLRVLKYLQEGAGLDEAAKNAWYHHWTRAGLESFEAQLLLLDAWQRGRGAAAPATFCYGEGPTMADCCLVPLIFNARRFEVPLDGLPRTLAAFDACMALRAFQAALPEACPDAPR
jgi:maleylacetoacetate isomerase/maleylpyruvate isomerase